MAFEIDEGLGWQPAFRLRDTPERAQARFESWARDIKASTRLVEVRVLKQRNRRIAK